MTGKLSSSIEDLYRAFSDIEIPRVIEGCPCCIDDKNIADLLSIPLREISPDTLATYASSAFLTVGEIADYLYFLPRIIEISITDRDWWPDFEVTARAIKDSGVQSWPGHRRDAHVSLLEAWMDDLIETEDVWGIDGLMCGVGRMELDVKPFLDRIQRRPAAVIAFWEENAASLQVGELSNEFWERPSRQHDDIVEWFRSETIEKMIATAASDGKLWVK